MCSCTISSVMIVVIIVLECFCFVIFEYVSDPPTWDSRILSVNIEIASIHQVSQQKNIEKK